MTNIDLNSNSCEYKEDLVSYLYEELDSNEKVSFERHMHNCKTCSEELKEFKYLRKEIKSWEIQSIPSFEIKIQPTLLQSFKIFVRSTSLWGRFVLAGTGALVVAALLNINIDINSNGVTFQTSLLPSKSQTATYKPEINSTRGYTQSDIQALIQTLVKTSEDRQDTKLKIQLQQLSDQIAVSNKATLLKTISFVKSEQKRQRSQNLIEAEQTNKPDLIDLIGQANLYDQSLD